MAAEATAARIVASFMALLEQRSYEDITLDEVAAGAGVTRQTVIRKFGDKRGLILETGRAIGERVRETRWRTAASPADAVAMVVADYERTGDIVVAILTQEDRCPDLGEVLEIGRAAHRAWVEETFGRFLAGLPPDVRERRLTQLVVVTDVWVWRVLRRDQKRPAEEVSALVADLVAQLLKSRED